MDRVTAANTIDLGGGRRGFRDRNDGAGLRGTGVPASHLNAQQEEIMAVLASAGVVPDAGNWAQLIQAIRRLLPRNMIAYTTAGTYSFAVPSYVDRLWLAVWGAGGGGGGTSNGGAAGGSGGGYAEGWKDVTPGSTLPVVVGAGGAAGSGAPQAGTAGGTSSVASLISASGGRGGAFASGGGTAAVTGSVGTGFGGDLNIPGGPANAGQIISGVSLGSAGGPAYSSSIIAGFSTGAGNNANWPGGGGGGAGGGTNAEGKPGAPGLVLIRY